MPHEKCVYEKDADRREANGVGRKGEGEEEVQKNRMRLIRFNGLQHVVFITIAPFHCDNEEEKKNNSSSTKKRNFVFKLVVVVVALSLILLPESFFPVCFVCVISNSKSTANTAHKKGSFYSIHM